MKKTKSHLSCTKCRFKYSSADDRDSDSNYDTDLDSKGKYVCLYTVFPKSLVHFHIVTILWNLNKISSTCSAIPYRIFRSKTIS